MEEMDYRFGECLTFKHFNSTSMTTSLADAMPLPGRRRGLPYA
jgi:hypothetical protein